MVIFIQFTKQFELGILDEDTLALGWLRIWWMDEEHYQLLISCAFEGAKVLGIEVEDCTVK